MGLPGGTFNEDYGQDTAVVRTGTQWILFISLLLVLIAIPFFTSNYILSVINVIGISIIAVHGLNILTGLSGQISLGQAAFVAVGAYTSAILATKLGLSFWVW